MVTRLRRLLVVCSLVVSLAAPVFADERADLWNADLRALQTQLEDVHPRFSGCGLPAELRQEFAAVAAKVNTLTDAQIVVELQRLLARVGDGHTLVWPFGMQRGALQRLPLGLWQFEEGLYVVRADDAALVGHRVTRIGALSADDALAKLEPFISHDNEQQFRWAAPLYLTFTDFLVAIGATSDRNAVALQLDDGRDVQLASVPVRAQDLETKLTAPPAPFVAAPYLARRDEKFRSQTLASGALYVQVNAIDDDGPRTLDAFARELRPLLAKTDRAILDLRLDNGGEASKANELLESLIAFDVRGGHIAVLTSRMTFSAAQTLATRLDEWTNAIFIGEATGSRPNHYGNERPFRLPGSGVRGTISSGFNQPVTARDERTTIAPDVAVPMRAADYFRGADPVLAAASHALSRR